MKLKILAVAALAAFTVDLSVWHSPVFAQNTVLDRLSGMERRVQHLESRVATQDKVIVAKDRELERLKKADEKKSGNWFNKIEITGGVELEAAYSSPYVGDATSDATVATAAVGIRSQMHDWVAAEIGLLYEEDDTPLEVDVATITVAPPNGHWSFKGGQFYVPFGVYESRLISDPLTLEIGETRETALQVGFDIYGFSGAVYGFNGTNSDGGSDRIDGYGAAVGYRTKGEHSEIALGLGYISDIGDSDNLQDVIAATLGARQQCDHGPCVALDSQCKAQLRPRDADRRICRRSGTLPGWRSALRRPRCAARRMECGRRLRFQDRGQGRDGGYRIPGDR